MAILLKYGFNPLAIDSNHNTPLHLACLKGNNLAIRSLLLANTTNTTNVRSPENIGRMLSGRNSQNFTALHMLVVGATSHKFLESFKLLHDAAVLAKQPQAIVVDEAMIIATKSNNAFALRALIDYMGGDVNAVDEAEGVCCLSWACMNLNVAIVDLLVGEGCDLEFVSIVEEGSGTVLSTCSPLTVAISGDVTNERRAGRKLTKKKRAAQQKILSIILAATLSPPQSSSRILARTLLLPTTMTILSLASFIGDYDILDLLLMSMLHGEGTEILLAALMPPPLPPPPTPPPFSHHTITNTITNTNTNTNMILSPLQTSLLHPSALPSLIYLTSTSFLSAILAVRKREIEDETFKILNEEIEMEMKLAEEEPAEKKEEEPHHPHSVEVIYAPDGSLAINLNVPAPKSSNEFDERLEKEANEKISNLKDATKKNVQNLLLSEDELLEKLLCYSSNSDGMNSLQYGVLSGGVEAVDYLFENLHCDLLIKMVQQNGISDLNLVHLAIKSGRVAMVTKILEAVSDLNCGELIGMKESQNGDKPLRLAVRLGVKEIVAEVKNYQERYGGGWNGGVEGEGKAEQQNLLLLAAELNHVGVFQLLFDIDNDKYKYNYNYNGAEGVANVCARFDRVEIFNLARASKSFDMNERDDLGLTPFLTAVTHNSKQILKCFLDIAEINTSARDANGCNCFHIQTTINGGDLASLAADKGLLQERNHNLKTPLELAIETNEELALKWIDEEIEGENVVGPSVLGLALKAKSKKIVEAVIKKGGLKVKVVGVHVRPIIFDCVSTLDLPFLEWFMKTVYSSLGVKVVENLLRGLDKNGENLFFHLVDVLDVVAKKVEVAGSDEEEDEDEDESEEEEEEEEEEELRHRLRRKLESGETHTTEHSDARSIFDFLLSQSEIDFLDILSQSRTRDGRHLIHLAAANKDLVTVKQLMALGEKLELNVANQIDSRKQKPSAVAAKLGATKVSTKLFNAEKR